MPRKTRFWERDARRLPGKLADETTEQWVEARAPRVEAEAGRWVPRPDVEPTPLHDRLQREYNALLLERDEAVAELADALARIRGLEQTVRALAGHAGTEAER